VSTPARAEKTPSALQGASRFGHQAGARRRPGSAREAPQQRPRKTARARARPPAPALGAGALGPEGLGLWGLRAWGPWGPLGTWALGRARGRSRSPRGHARLTKTGAAADKGSLHADPAARAAMLG